MYIEYLVSRVTEISDRIFTQKWKLVDVKRDGGGRERAKYEPVEKCDIDVG